MMYYRVIKKKNPLAKEESGDKYTAKSVPTGKVSNKEICENIKDYTGIKPAVFNTCLAALKFVFKYYLKAGYTLHLEGIGSFYPVISSKMYDNEKDVQNKTLNKIKIRFRPDRELLQEVQNAPVKKRYLKIEMDEQP